MAMSRGRHGLKLDYSGNTQKVVPSGEMPLPRPRAAGRENRNRILGIARRTPAAVGFAGRAAELRRAQLREAANPVRLAAIGKESLPPRSVAVILIKLRSQGRILPGALA